MRLYSIDEEGKQLLIPETSVRSIVSTRAEGGTLYYKVVDDYNMNVVNFTSGSAEINGQINLGKTIIDLGKVRK